MADSPRLVQSGPRDAKILMVGEAPAENEERSGVPFSGGGGYILDSVLDSAGIIRSKCFLTNVVHDRSPDKKFTWFFKKPNQLIYLRGVLQLKRDIEAIRPNVVVAFGEHALKVLCGKDSITKWRGSILESTLVKGQKVISTYNPA